MIYVVDNGVGIAPTVETELRALTALCDGGMAPSDAEVQDVLERGFAYLIFLEARLQRVLDGDITERDDAGGPYFLPGDVEQRIVSLRSALSDLRRRRARGRRVSLSHGFVLPLGRCEPPGQAS